MREFQKAPLLLLFGLLVSCARNGVELKFNHQTGQVAQYHLVSEVRTRTTTGSTTSNYTINIDMVVNYTVTRILEKGDAEILFTYDKIRYLNTQNPAQTEEVIRQLRDLKVYLTLSPYGEITGLKGYENIPRIYVEDFNIFNLLMKALPVFPRTPIAVGKRWERQQEFPIENGLIKGNMLVYKRFSLLDTSTVDNARIARIGTEINMKFDVPNTEAFSLQQDGNERLGLFGTGTIRFNLTQGEAQSANAAIFGKMVVSIKHPVSGNRINTRIEIAQSIAINKI
jgi:hypothetical protein